MKCEKVKLKHAGDDKEAFMEILSQEYEDEYFLKKLPLALIFPGGGYGFIADREGTPMALMFASWGYVTAIVRYSVRPREYPSQYFEAFDALQYMTEHAEEYNVDVNRIVSVGFSAGGHLAAMLATGLKDPVVLKEFGVSEDYFKLAGMVLSYPVITSGEFAHRGSFNSILGDRKDDEKMLAAMSIENRVTADTPKTFMWSTFEDSVVPCENVLLLAKAMRKQGVPFELHVFPEGGHGTCLGTAVTMSPTGGGLNQATTSWPELAHSWLEREIGYEGL